MSKGDRAKDKLSVILAYLGFCFGFPPFVAFFFTAGTDFGRFHAKQGAYLTTIALGVGVLMQVGALLSGVLGGGRTLSRVLLMLLGFLFLFYVLVNFYCLVKALRGEQYKLPLIGKMAA